VDLGKLDPGLIARQGVHVGPVLEVEQVIRRPADKRAAGEAHHALAADLESLAVAEACRGRSVPFLAVRVVSDAVDDELPGEVEKLVRQKSRTAQLGAALGAILDRPGSLREMYRLHANALAASDRLARFLAALIEHVVPREN
jgi:adenosylhomocysteine nucleosidase